MIHPEEQYLNLIRQVLNDGKMVKTRNGNRLTIYGAQLRFDLTQGFAAITSKKLAWDKVVSELLWFLEGHTNTRYLHTFGNHIWDENADTNGDIFAGYGAQWRRYDCGTASVALINARYIETDATPYLPTDVTWLEPSKDADDLIGKSIVNISGHRFTPMWKLKEKGGKNSNYIVQFESGAVVKASRPNIRYGMVSDPYAITVYGVGCIGDDSFTPSYRERAYNLWHSMIARCYSKSHPQYGLYGE